MCAPTSGRFDSTPALEQRYPERVSGEAAPNLNADVLVTALVEVREGDSMALLQVAEANSHGHVR